MELGMAGRGEHSEILSFVGRTVDSELSGNMIDLCPVGALTSKPFRFSARTWELTRRKSISPHCALGSNLVVQIKHDRVLRVLPLENEEINECWLSDKDRFSYEGLNAPSRLTAPMIRHDGKWEAVAWPVALEAVAQGLKRVRDQHGPQAIGALATPHSTFEELYLLGKLVRGIGSGNVDFRLRQSDFGSDGQVPGAPWLGMRISEINSLDRVLVVGSDLRKDHPLIAARLRQGARKGTQVSIVHSVADDWRIALRSKLVVAPSALTDGLLQVVRALAETKRAPVAEWLAQASAQVSVGEPARRIAESLESGQNGAVLLGNFAQHHPQAAELHAIGAEIARLAGARVGFLGEAANSVGGYLAGAVPFAQPAGLNARDMLAQPRKAYLLFNTEVELDCHDGRQALAAMRAAQFVVAMSPFMHKAMEYAHVLLPIAPFTETAGSFVNTEGRLQSFNGVVKPLAETRPGWKVLRVLGNLMGAAGFEFASAEEVRAEALQAGDIQARLSNAAPAVQLSAVSAPPGIQRIGEVTIYRADGIVRRAESLQRTHDAQAPRATMPGSLMQRLGLRDGDHVRVTQGAGEAVLPVVRDDRLPADCVRIPAADPVTAALGAMFGTLALARVSAQQEVTA
jgi:NADH-quinone oxidoreductase subunit G